MKFCIVFEGKKSLENDKGRRRKEKEGEKSRLEGDEARGTRSCPAADVRCVFKAEEYRWMGGRFSKFDVLNNVGGGGEGREG